MQLFFRSVVSAPKNTFYDPQFEFEYDLAYVTPQLIACSAPSNTYPLTLYRYPLKSLILWLKQQQLAGNVSAWHIFNLRGEGPGYRDGQVQFRVSHYPFPDHHPPSVALLESCTKEMHAFISANPKNTVIVHCKEGKGRLGTICCAYLMYERHIAGESLPVAEAIAAFSVKRMRSFAGDAVSIPSQRRYLGYWHHFLAQGKPPSFSAAVVPRITSIRLVDYALLTGDESSDMQIIQGIWGLDLKIGIYEIGADPRKSLILKPLCSAVISLINIIREHQTVEIVFRNCHIPHSAGSNVFINFKGWYYTWFDMEYESVLNPKREFNVTWDEIDGFKGTSYKGRKQFELLTVLFEI